MPPDFHVVKPRAAAPGKQSRQTSFLGVFVIVEHDDLAAGGRRSEKQRVGFGVGSFAAGSFPVSV
jgi:hypothetical protein